jgi:disulfide bond formation protein DsbB
MKETLQRTQLAGAALLAAGMAATVGTALAFQHIGGYIPCKLCLEQRIPYYIGIPLMIAAALLAWSGQARMLSRILIAAGGLLMAWGLVLAVYHSGVEWHWWAGPSDCGAVDSAPGGSGGGVLDMLDKVVPPSCDEAAGRFLGLSFAGWNAVASLILGAFAFRTALRRN